MQYKPKETLIYALYNASKTINILQYILTKKIQKKIREKADFGSVVFLGGGGYGWRHIALNTVFATF